MDTKDLELVKAQIENMTISVFCENSIDVPLGIFILENVISDLRKNYIQLLLAQQKEDRAPEDERRKDG